MSDLCTIQCRHGFWYKLRHSWLRFRKHPSTHLVTQREAINDWFLYDFKNECMAAAIKNVEIVDLDGIWPKFQKGNA